MIFRSVYNWLAKRPWAVVLLMVIIIHAGFRPLVVSAASVVIDSTVNTGNTTHNGTTFTDVFTNDQTGYAFYREADGTCSYRKTTNGGLTWGSTVTVQSRTDCIRIAVWYDNWTPGVTTGTLIHIATMDTTQDDLWYTSLDTSSDTLSTPVSISSGTQASTYAAGGNLQSITRTRDGTIYIGAFDTQDSFVMRCTGSCTSFSSWSEAGTSTTWTTSANDWMLLLPLGTSSNVMIIRWVIGTDNVHSRIWNNGTLSWGASTTIATCQNNTTYDGHFGATLNKLRGDIYLVSACDTQTIDGNNDDIRAYTYYNSSSSWATSSDVTTNDAKGITGVKVGLDANTGNIYAIYSARAAAGGANTANVYYRISTSTMANWGPELGPVNSTSGDIYGLRIDGLNDERIYATWIIGTTSTLDGATIADLAPVEYDQTSYRFFGNNNAAATGPVFDSLQNVSSVIPNATGTFRMRMLIHSTSGVDVGGQDFNLQYATGTSGSCTGTQSNFVDLSPSTGSIRFYDNPGVSDGVALSASTTDPTHGADTVVNESYEEANPFSVITRIQPGQDGKWDFSLQNVSGLPLETFCFRATKSDGTILTSYTRTPEVTVNATSVVSLVSLNSDASIGLTEGTTTQVQATGRVVDGNGVGDIIGASAIYYRSGVGPNCTPDNNNCYSVPTCSLNNCSGNQCDASCIALMWFYADPTDSGTPWASEDWHALITARDARSTTASASSSFSVDVLTLLGIAVGPAISYGNLSPGSTTDPIVQQTFVSSTGNASVDLGISGVAMTSGANSISSTQQRYATSSRPFASSTQLTTTSTAMDVNLRKPTSSTILPTSTLFWGIQVPNPQPTGLYTGGNTVIGVTNALPWP